MTSAMHRRGWMAGAVVMVLAIAVAATPVRAQDSLDSALLIGSSFSRRVHRELVQLVRSVPLETVVQRRCGNSWTLAMHSQSLATLRRIQSRAWNVVVLQEQSHGLDGEHYPCVRSLDAEIAAIGARTVFFLTWADRDEGLEVYDRLLGESGGTTGCVPIAEELDAAIAPADTVSETASRGAFEAAEEPPTAFRVVLARVVLARTGAGRFPAFPPPAETFDRNHRGTTTNNP